MFKIGLNNFKGGGVGFGVGGTDRVCCGCGVHFVKYAFFTIKNALLLNFTGGSNSRSACPTIAASATEISHTRRPQVQITLSMLSPFVASKLGRIKVLNQSFTFSNILGHILFENVMVIGIPIDKRYFHEVKVFVTL